MTRLTGPWIPKSFVEVLPDRLNQQVLGSPAWKSAAVLLVLSAIVYFIIMNKRHLLGLEKAGRKTLLFAACSRATACRPALVFQQTDTRANSCGRCLVRRYQGGHDRALQRSVLVAVAHNRSALRGTCCSLQQGREKRRSEHDAIGGAHHWHHRSDLVDGLWPSTAGYSDIELARRTWCRRHCGRTCHPTDAGKPDGGFVLFLDKPIRVGDYCTFGSFEGVVERIGVRSTQVRAMDRTLITIPNSQFANIELVNWAMCDQMMIQGDSELDMRRTVTSSALCSLKSGKRCTRTRALKTTPSGSGWTDWQLIVEHSTQSLRENA